LRGCWILARLRIDVSAATPPALGDMTDGNAPSIPFARYTLVPSAIVTELKTGAEALPARKTVVRRIVVSQIVRQ